ncbi:MAG TPA: phosphoribosyltransferase [Patescibacteria group bacterium]|nr:phosphoribosyltransferase [Patescibacteria group bacterium]
MLFRDRTDAGKRLAQKLQSYAGMKDTIIIGLPRGGVVVAYEVAKTLQLPLDIIVPRKIGAPHNPEFAIGAITEDGAHILNHEIVSAIGVSHEYIQKISLQEQTEAQRRLKMYRAGKPPLDLQHKTAIIVDDGVATGYTMRAAIRSVKIKGAQHVVIAVPVAAIDSVQELRLLVNEMVVVFCPVFLGSVGSFYEYFDQVEDSEVIHLLDEANYVKPTADASS